jgi:hypothetical protein
MRVAAFFFGEQTLIDGIRSLVFSAHAGMSGERDGHAMWHFSPSYGQLGNVPSAVAGLSTRPLALTVWGLFPGCLCPTFHALLAWLRP